METKNNKNEAPIEGMKRTLKSKFGTICVLVFWLSLIATPFAVGFCSDSLLFSAISIVYGVIMWEVLKRFSPDWIKRLLLEFVNTEI